MKVGLRSGDGAEERLQFAQQIGADGASIWAWACPGYRERDYVTVENVAQMRERFERYDLDLTGIGLGARVMPYRREWIATTLLLLQEVFPSETHRNRVWRYGCDMTIHP